jgi:hypothetical protein
MYVMSEPEATLPVVSRKIPPFRDPSSTKYPDRTYLAGRWLTEEQIEALRLRRYRNHKAWAATEKGLEACRPYNATPERYLAQRRRTLLSRREQIVSQLEELKGATNGAQ